MSAFLFLQRFHHQKPAVLRCEDVAAFLASHGTAGGGVAGALEFSFEGETVAEVCSLVGEADTGLWCIALEGPRYDDALRQLAWGCMVHFGCAVFDDTLELAYVRMNGLHDLPEAMVAAARNGVRRISSAQQLWPDGLSVRTEGPARRALRWPNPNPAGTQRQVFDGLTQRPRELFIELALRPEAANPATLSALRKLEAQVDAALRANPGYTVAYRVSHAATLQALLAKPAVGELLHAVAAGSDQAPRPGENRFVADRQVFAASKDGAAQFIAHALAKHRVSLEGGGGTGVRRLSRLLDHVHLLYQQERTAHTGDGVFSSRLALKWAIRAGAYLGEAVRRKVGGQWGHISRGRQRQWVLRCHTGRLCHPHLQVLDHIINGSTSSVATWFGQLVLDEMRAQPQLDDWAANIPALCASLVNALPDAAADADLPLAAELPRDRLDYSLDSLLRLDDYLAQLVRRADEVSDAGRLAVMRAAGAYLGEVIRCNASRPTQWQWANYEDHLRSEPELADQRPRDGVHAVLLHSLEHKVYPWAHVAALLQGLAVACLYDHARQLLGETGADAEGEAGQALLPEPAPPDPAMATLLASARQALAQWRQIATRTDYKLLAAPAPEWLKLGGSADLTEQQAQLLAEGRVVWAALIQADKLVFQSGPADLPGDLVYSPDAHFDARPDLLRQIAAELLAQRGGTPQSWEGVATWWAGDTEPRAKLPVPTLLTDRETLVSPFIVFRRHLPSEAVKGQNFPLLVHPSSDALMVLPRRFWPPALVSRWTTA